MPGAMHEWSQRLPAILKYMQIEHRYMWERHVTLKAFWRLLLQGYEVGTSTHLAIGLWAASAGALAFGLTIGVVRNVIRNQDKDRMIAATIVAMPLLMPFYFDYDLLLLAVAAVLLAADRMRVRGSHVPVQGLDRAIVGAWVVLFVWMFANPFVAGQTHVNGTVLVLSGLAGMLVIKGYRAVGNALNRNPYAPAVPCHRVVGSNGSLTGFAHGIEKKRAMLQREGVRLRNGKVDLSDVFTFA